MTVVEEKAALRRRMRAAVGVLSPEFRQAASAATCARLLAQPVWRQARAVLLIAPTGSELDVWPCGEAALAEGKTVCLPRSLPNQDGYAACRVRDFQRDIVPGRFGIREPTPGSEAIPLNQLDFILVPGLGFDRTGHRLGRGRGYYDRWLTALRGLTCGLAYDEQLVGAIPVEAHDLTVDCILTPTRWIEVSPCRAELD